ncbi:Keratin, type I cytoskeletal 18 [Bagarius yarrelli]|uniref:Keratin, type I cytoskeletal 18 n=1 Tax=Bagarius yarrelli TaxID=175774 RepID=A0A556VUY6_BAGYA|nr:Keratin, type I cytoskeletal 18 [Bagarius yarrelli]
MFRGVRASSLGAEARLGRARSPVRAGVRSAMHRGEEKETMRGLNERLAGYLSQVRLLEEANSKLEEQIKNVVKERRAVGQRDWSAYEKTIFSIRDQGVEQDIINLRKMIDDTQMSSMQLEGEVETLNEELMYLRKNHEQIRDSSVDVQMDAAKGQDLSETIDKIRQQYELAAQKSREETEAWYRNKFDSISAEVSRNTDALQQGQKELNDLRRQKQGLEIDLQTMHSMNHSLEDTLNDTAGRYSQTTNNHNMIIQQLEAELAEVHAQVSRQGLEYQALLNIKSKLEEEIATYHSLLEGTGPPYNGFTVPALPKNYDFKGMRPQDDVNVESISPPKDGNVIDNSASENANTEASGLAGNESVEFSLEQALCAAPRKLSPDSEQTLGKKNAEEEMITQKDLELNAANIAKNNQYIHEEAGQEMEEDPAF